MPDIQRTDPEALSFLITAAFNFDNERKYRLLEITSTSDRLNELKEILDRTVGQMEASAEIQTVSRTNGHSNKRSIFSFFPLMPFLTFLYSSA